MSHYLHILAHALTDDIGDIITKLTALVAGVAALIVAITALLRNAGTHRMANDAQLKALEADTKASAAVTSIGKTNDRVNEVAIATQSAPLVVAVPAAPPNPPTPTAPAISAAMRAQEQQQRPNIPK